jgi:hypothetical protein
MNEPRDDIDHLWQHAAEHAPTGATDPEILRYRHLFEALRRHESPEAPVHFAVDLERRAYESSFDTGSGTERWGVRLGIVALLLILASTIMPAAPLLYAQAQSLPSGVPWPLLVAAAASLITLARIDRASTRAEGKVSID